MIRKDSPLQVANLKRQNEMIERVLRNNAYIDIRDMEVDLL